MFRRLFSLALQASRINYESLLLAAAVAAQAAHHDDEDQDDDGQHDDDDHGQRPEGRLHERGAPHELLLLALLAVEEDRLAEDGVLAEEGHVGGLGVEGGLGRVGVDDLKVAKVEQALIVAVLERD